MAQCPFSGGRQVVNTFHTTQNALQRYRGGRKRVISISDDRWPNWDHKQWEPLMSPDFGGYWFSAKRGLTRNWDMLPFIGYSWRYRYGRFCLYGEAYSLEDAWNGMCCRVEPWQLNDIEMTSWIVTISGDLMYMERWRIHFARRYCPSPQSTSSWPLLGWAQYPKTGVVIKVPERYPHPAHVGYYGSTPGWP